MIMMSDLDKPDFNHGGGTVSYTGQSQMVHRRHLAHTTIVSA
jgi:hypothetical protein